MAICHPFLVQRSRTTAKTTYHTVVHKTAGSSVCYKGNIERRATISIDVPKHDCDSKETTNWFKTMRLYFKSPQRGNPSPGMTLKKRTYHYLLPVLIFSILLNIPKFFEFETYVIQ